MSTLITVKVEADAELLEKATAGRPELLARTLSQAKEHGLVSHHFYAADGYVLVIDEWPDEASFHAFFDNTPEVRDIMMSAGAKGQPEVIAWRKLDLGDDYPS